MLKIAQKLLVAALLVLATVAGQPTPVLADGIECVTAEDQCEEIFGGNFISYVGGSCTGGWEGYQCCIGSSCPPIAACCRYSGGGCNPPIPEDCGGCHQSGGCGW